VELVNEVALLLRYLLIHAGCPSLPSVSRITPKMSLCLTVCHLWNNIFSVILSSFDTKKTVRPCMELCSALL